MIKPDSYSGPTLPDGTVPIVPLRRTWTTAGIHNSRLQLALKLAWAVTIHKSQGLTLNKAVVNIGKKEFSSGLTFVACSRVRDLTDLLFDPPFAFQRLPNPAHSHIGYKNDCRKTADFALYNKTLFHPLTCCSDSL